MIALAALWILATSTPRGLEGLMPGSSSATSIVSQDRVRDFQIGRGRQLLTLKVADPNRRQQIDLVLRQEWERSGEIWQPVIVARLVSSSPDATLESYADSRSCMALPDILRRA